jgi:hypothetical protein
LEGQELCSGGVATERNTEEVVLDDAFGAAAGRTVTERQMLKSYWTSLCPVTCGACDAFCTNQDDVLLVFKKRAKDKDTWPMTCAEAEGYTGNKGHDAAIAMIACGASSDKCGDGPQPAAIGEARFKIVATLTLEGDIEAVAGTEGSQRRTIFECAFKEDVASTLGVTAEQIYILVITAGSVKVEFEVMPLEGESLSSDDASNIEEAFNKAGIELPTVGAITTEAVSSVGVVERTFPNDKTGTSGATQPIALLAIAAVSAAAACF